MMKSRAVPSLPGFWTMEWNRAIYSRLYYVILFS